MHKTKEQTSVIQYGRVKSTPFKNIISYHMLQGMLWLASNNSVKYLWKKEFGGLPKNFGKPYERHTDKRLPAVISCSNFVFKRPSDWNENIHQYGYWFVQEPTEYTPSKELADFLSSGKKPVYVGFGSVFHKDQKEFLSKLIIDALLKANRRGIICGMGKLDNLPDNIIAIDSIPHSWLFEKVSAVCHHGGAGTTSAGFAAGVPSVIIPFANDQHAWAHRAYDLGVGSKPVPIKKLTSDNLAEAIKYALQDKIVQNAKRLAIKISTENGARECAKVIVDSLGR
jgi:sterol 3beta-glucosyltransferase